MLLSRSAKLYQERRQPEHRTTRRTPGLHQDVALNAARRVALHPPHPSPQRLRAAEPGCCDLPGQAAGPPDGGLTTPWLHGSEELA